MLYDQGFGPEEVDRVDALKCARDYVAKGWTQGTNWRDANGHGSAPHNAASCCAIGAIIKASPFTRGMQLDNDLVALLWSTLGDGRAHHEGLAAWNDAEERTQAEVLALFDHAIAIEAEETSK